MYKFIALLFVFFLGGCTDLKLKMVDVFEADNYEDVDPWGKKCIEDWNNNTVKLKSREYAYDITNFCEKYSETNEYKKFRKKYKKVNDAEKPKESKKMLEKEKKANVYCDLVYEEYQASLREASFNPEAFYKSLVKRILGGINNDETNQAVKTVLKMNSSELRRDIYAFTTEIIVDCKSDKFKKIVKKIESYYVPIEKEIFLERTGGKYICATDIDFLGGLRYRAPDKNCFYGMQPNKVLFASQVTKEGILAYYDFGYPTDIRGNFFIYKSDIPDGVVDGSMIYGVFEYTGAYTYHSLTGQRTIHSFRRPKWDDYMKDIYFYYGYKSH